MLARARSRLALRGRADRLLAPLRAVLDRARGRTSVTDRGAYTQLCDRAARDPRVFASFKNQRSYTEVLEHVTCSMGAEYLRITLEQTPEFGALLERFRENDRLGEPQTCDYGEHGRFSATTLRYAKVSSDLGTLFGSLDGLRIIEIGAGYGGQCFITGLVSSVRSYTIVDLDPCLRLQKTYLGQLGVTNVHFVSPDAVAEDGVYDLVVSNYAFTECVREVQEVYLARVLGRSTRGYVTCNWISPRQFRSLMPEELTAAIPGSRFLPERPLTAPANRIWHWGAMAGTLTSAPPCDERENDRRTTR